MLSGNTARCRRGYYRVRVHGKARITALKTEEVFSKFEDFHTETKIHVGLATDPLATQEVAESAFRLHYAQHFVQRLKEDLTLRRKVGKSTWDVKYIDLVVKVDKDLIID